MTVPFLKAYSELLIQTCHRRGAFAMGGMAAQIPIKGDEAANEAAMAKVRADKLREVQAGHDGTWVAHPALVPVAQAIFDEYMPGAEPARACCARTSASPASSCWPRLRRHDQPRRLRQQRGGRACATPPPGWTASAACRSTT